MPQIFSPEAVATLATGFAAVIAATVVGLKQAAIMREQLAIAARQTEIAARQTEILAAQAKVDEARHKSELFEKRYKIYQIVSTYIGMALLNENAPTWESEKSFLSAMDESTFLFGKNVRSSLEEVAHAVNEHAKFLDAPVAQTAKREAGLSASSARLRSLLASLSSILGPKLDIS